MSAPDRAARRHGELTIEQTKFGQYLTRMTEQGTTLNPIRNIHWDRASRHFARSADGPVQGTFGRADISTDSAFSRVELPVFLFNRRVPSLTMRRAGSWQAPVVMHVSRSLQIPQAQELVAQGMRDHHAVTFVFT